MRRSFLVLVVVGAVAAFVGCTKSQPSTGEPGGTEGTTASATTEGGDPSAKGSDETGPVAMVNGKPVPRADFDEMYDKMTRVYTKRNQPVPENVARRHKKNILKRLIEKDLLGQAIAKAGVAVTPEELNEGLAKYKEMFRTDANFDRYLKNSNTSLEKIQDNIRYNKSLDKLLEKEGPIEVTEQQAQEYYTQNKRRYEEREQVKASHVLFKVEKDAKPEADAAARKQAADVAAAAKKPGADFAELAKKHSQGPTAPKGGNLGYFARGRMDKAFEDVAFALKPGQVSAPVRSKFGWHVIKLFDHRAAGEKPFEEVKESISKLLESRERRLRKSRLLRDLRAAAKIEQLLEIPDPVPTAAQPGMPSISMDKIKGAAGSVKLTPMPVGPTAKPGPGTVMRPTPTPMVPAPTPMAPAPTPKAVAPAPAP